VRYKVVVVARRYRSSLDEDLLTTATLTLAVYVKTILAVVTIDDKSLSIKSYQTQE
jgi:hypothetical protein